MYFYFNLFVDTRKKSRIRVSRSYLSKWAAQNAASRNKKTHKNLIDTIEVDLNNERYIFALQRS